jgi:hypothetical protein
MIVKMESGKFFKTKIGSIHQAAKKTLLSPVPMIVELRAASQFKDCPKMRSYIVLEQDVI